MGMAERDTARAMSQENVEIVKVVYEPLASGGLEQALEAAGLSE